MKTTLITVALMAVLAAAMPAVSHDDIAYASLERRLVTSRTVKGRAGGRRFYYDIGTGKKTTTVEKNELDSRVYTNDRTGSLSQQHDTEEDKTVEVITVDNVEDTEAKDGITETNNFNTLVQETVDENSITGTYTDDTDRTDTDTWSLVNTGDKTTQGSVTTNRLVLNSSLNLEVVDNEDNIRITNSSDQTDSVVETQDDRANDTEGETSVVTKVSSSRSILATDADITDSTEKLVAGNVRNDKVSGLTSTDEETIYRDGAAVEGTYESVFAQNSSEDNVDDDVFSEQESSGLADGEYKVDDITTGEGYSSTDFEETDGTSSSTTAGISKTSGLYETEASGTESGSLNTDGELDLTKDFKTEGYEEDYQEVIFDGVTKKEADTNVYNGDYVVEKIGDTLTENTLDVVAYSDYDEEVDGTLDPDFTYEANLKSVSVDAKTVRDDATDGTDDTFNELRITVDGVAQQFQETNGDDQKSWKDLEVTDTETLITDTDYITGEELIKKVETTVGGYTEYDESKGTAGVLQGEVYDETPVETNYSTTGGDANHVNDELRQVALDAIKKAEDERLQKEEDEKFAQDDLDKQIEDARVEADKAIEAAINAARMLQPNRRSARAGRWNNRRIVSFRT